MPWDMLLPVFLALCEYALHVLEADSFFFTGDPLIFGNVELATQNLAHWYSLTSVTG